MPRGECNKTKERMAALDRAKVLNFNVGVLGHIDSGKTSLGEENYLYKRHRFLGIYWKVVKSIENCTWDTKNLHSVVVNCLFLIRWSW